MLGVRVPVIRKYAKEILKENTDWQKILEEDDVYFEETMLRGFIIGMATLKEDDVELAKEKLAEFVPYIDNWSINDSFCNAFKIAGKHGDDFIEINCPYPVFIVFDSFQHGVNPLFVAAEFDMIFYMIWHNILSPLHCYHNYAPYILIRCETSSFPVPLPVPQRLICETNPRRGQHRAICRCQNHSESCRYHRPP